MLRLFNNTKFTANEDECWNRKKGKHKLSIFVWAHFVILYCTDELNANGWKQQHEKRLPNIFVIRDNEITLHVCIFVHIFATFQNHILQAKD